MASSEEQPTTSTSEVEDIDGLIQERLKLGRLQVSIPPSQITVLPNGKQVLFLGPNHNAPASNLSLQVMNLEDNESNVWGQVCDFTAISSLSTELSLEQKLLRERQRTSAHGITSYSFHASTSQLVFQYGPHLTVAHLPPLISSFNSVPVIKIGNPSMDDKGTRMDSNLTPDGCWIVYSRNDDLWITTSRPNLLSKEDQAQIGEIQVTFAGTKKGDITAGVADFINQEEFDRFTGYWISPKYRDFKNGDVAYREYKILYLEADNTEVPTITIPSMDGIEQHKWPRSGETNCSFQVKVVTVAVPVTSCAVINGDAAPSDSGDVPDSQLSAISNLTVDTVIITDYAMTQSIYSSFPWIEYIVRAGWTSRDNECWIQYLDRDQMKTNVAIYQFGAHFSVVGGDGDDEENDSKMKDATDSNGALCGQQMFFSEGTPWINIHDTFCWIDEGLLWSSEHSGFKHLYFIPFPAASASIDSPDDNGGDEKKENDPTKVAMSFVTPTDCKVQQLTSGRWEVEAESIWVDQRSKMKTVYFRGRKDSHLEKHLYAATFDPNQSGSVSLKQLTQSGCFHDTNVDAVNFAYFSSVYSSVSKPNQFAIYSIDGKVIKEFTVPYRGKPKLLKYVEPEIVSIPNFPADATKEELADPEYVHLHTFSAVIYPPFDEENAKTKKSKKGGYPTIIYVYGGPHVQLITNSWARVTGNSRAQMWRTMGFTVATIDSRGSNHRGLASEGRIKYKMGQIEMQDQVKLVQYLVDRGLTNPKKVGITGWSYGGYMSLMAMCQRPDVFVTGIAGAPVTMWELYDTGYTERYMGTPQKQPDGYRDGAVIKYVANFPEEENRLVIVHGLGDENVHFYHTSKLIKALVESNKPYVLKIYPGERHGIRQWQNLVYSEKFMVQHFRKMLCAD